MTIGIITNPGSGSSEQFEQLRSLIGDRQDVAIWETSTPGEAPDLVGEAVRAGCRVVVAAGGDGTVNEVVNGLMPYRQQAALGILPLGTGNDLARTLALPEDPRAAFAFLEAGRREPIDVIRVTSDATERYGINVAAGGFSGQVDGAMSSDLKSNWGPLAYLLGAASVLPDVTHYHTRLRYDDEEWEMVSALNIIVANGRTAAGGRRVAPLANPQDGLLDVVIVRSGTMIEMAEVAARLLTGNYIDSPLVLHRRVSSVHISSEPGMWFNIDGELISNDCISFEAVPGALEVIVGNDFKADPTL